MAPAAAGISRDEQGLVVDTCMTFAVEDGLDLSFAAWSDGLSRLVGHGTAATGLHFDDHQGHRAGIFEPECDLQLLSFGYCAKISYGIQPLNGGIPGGIREGGLQGCGLGCGAVAIGKKDG